MSAFAAEGKKRIMRGVRRMIIRGTRRILLVTLAALSLAACSLVEPHPGPVSRPPVTRGPPPVPPVPPRPPAPPRAAASEGPDRLLGLDEAGVTALLGRPGLTRDRDMGRLWRYRKGHCVLALIFFPEVEGGGLRVASYDFEHGGRKSCWRRLRAAGGRHVR